MILLYLSIPLMLLALALAVLPFALAMAAERRGGLAPAGPARPQTRRVAPSSRAR